MVQKNSNKIKFFALLVSLLCTSNLKGAIDIVFDYRYDTLQWFGNEQRYILDQAAYAWETRLVSENFVSVVPEAGKTAYLTTFGNQTVQFGDTVTDSGETIGAANTVVIFPNVSWPHRISSSVGTNSNLQSYTYQNTEAAAGTTWWNLINNTKDTSSRFESAGGGLSFWMKTDQDDSIQNWYYDTDLLTTPYEDNSGDNNASSKQDFYSHAVAGIGRILGFDNTTAAYSANSEDDPNSQYELWNGSNAMTEYSNTKVPHASALIRHWPMDKSKVVCDCHSIFSNILTHSSSYGKRHGVSDLDVAILKDIGLNMSNDPVSPVYSDSFQENENQSYGLYGWTGTHIIPVKQTWSDWKTSSPLYDASLPEGGWKGSNPTPEPHYIFPVLGAVMAFAVGRKKKFFQKIKFPGKGLHIRSRISGG